MPQAISLSGFQVITKKLFSVSVLVTSLNQLSINHSHIFPRAKKNCHTIIIRCDNIVSTAAKQIALRKIGSHSNECKKNRRKYQKPPFCSVDFVINAREICACGCNKFVCASISNTLTSQLSSFEFQMIEIYRQIYTKRNSIN